MRKAAKTILNTTLVGASLGIAIGVAIALFHFNVRPPMIARVALTPSVSGFLIDGATGLLVGLTASRIQRRYPGKQ